MMHRAVSQGGISKATRGLNLSEDIFAGMDAMLRGHTVVHREYFMVGKGARWTIELSTSLHQSQRHRSCTPLPNHYQP